MLVDQALRIAETLTCTLNGHIRTDEIMETIISLDFVVDPY